MLGKIITRNRMMGTEQPDKILFPTNVIGGSVSIANTIRNKIANCMDPIIQPVIAHPKQSTEPGHSEQNRFPIRSLNIGIGVTIPGKNIDNHTGMNPHGTIVTTTPESNRSNNFNIFESTRRTSYLAYGDLPWHGTMKSENENLAKKLEATTFSKMLSARIISKFENLGVKTL